LRGYSDKRTAYMGGGERSTYAKSNHSSTADFFTVAIVAEAFLFCLLYDYYEAC